MIYNKLYKFQKDIHDKALSHDRYALFLDMGLGKTYTSLAISETWGNKKILVICQPSKLDDWASDIESELNFKTAVLGGGKAKDDKLLDNFSEGAVIVSYNTVWRRDKIEKLLDEDWVIICDESQYMKNPKSKVGKWGAKHSHKAGKLLLLSGTPQSNGYEDLFNQMVMLGMKMSFKEFKEKFCITKEMKLPGQRWTFESIVGYKNEDLLLSALATQSVSLKTEEAIDLPNQVFSDIRIVNENQKTYDKILKNKIYDELAIDTPAGMFLRLRQLSSGFIEQYKGLSTHKVNALSDLLDSSENNFLIFYNFNQELEDIKELMKSKGIEVYELNGSKKDYLEAKDSKKRFVILAQYISGSEGHNIQFVNHTIYYSPPLMYSQYAQSLKRTHRIGQDDHCFYYRLITKNSIETKIYSTLAKGKDYSEKVFEKSGLFTNA